MSLRGAAHANMLPLFHFSVFISFRGAAHANMLPLFRFSVFMSFRGVKAERLERRGNQLCRIMWIATLPLVSLIFLHSDSCLLHCVCHRHCPRYFGTSPYGKSAARNDMFLFCRFCLTRLPRLHFVSARNDMISSPNAYCHFPPCHPELVSGSIMTII